MLYVIWQLNDTPKQMSSRVIITNNTEFSFKRSTIVFCEIDGPAEKFWKIKNSGSLVQAKETVVCGKLIHSDDLPTGCNFVVSIILSVEGLASFDAHKSFINLKGRVKGSKTGSKLYAYASSFPEQLSLTPPQWRKGTSKNYYLANFLDKTMQVKFFISWNDKISFTLDIKDERPAFCVFSKSRNNQVIEEFYENQWKSKSMDRTKYTHNPISLSNHRPPFSTINGSDVLHRSQIMPPSPLWEWLDDWHIDCLSESRDGWIYIEDWKSSCLMPEHSTQFRMRRWIRTRATKKKTEDQDRKDLDFISSNFRKMVESLAQAFPPFLKELKIEVMARPEDFDFHSLAAIPSPKMRRELKVYSN